LRADLDTRHLCISTIAMAFFLYTEEAFLDAVWSLDPQSPHFVEERKREIVVRATARPGREAHEVFCELHGRGRALQVDRHAHEATAVDRP
jgi:hypothetical protein